MRIFRGGDEDLRGFGIAAGRDCEVGDGGEKGRTENGQPVADFADLADRPVDEIYAERESDDLRRRRERKVRGRVR